MIYSEATAAARKSIKGVKKDAAIDILVDIIGEMAKDRHALYLKYHTLRDAAMDCVHGTLKVLKEALSE